jgi:hypothetical protein
VPSLAKCLVKDLPSFSNIRISDPSATAFSAAPTGRCHISSVTQDVDALKSMNWGGAELPIYIYIYTGGAWVPCS